MSVCALLVSVILALISFIAYKVHRRFNYWQSRGIACDKPSYIQGNLQGLLKERSFADCFTTYYRKYKGTGPFAGFYWFQQPAVVLLDKQLIKQILITDFSNFVNRGFFSNERDDPLTVHLFALDGQRWRTMRNKISPTFTSGKMKFMFPTILKVGHEFVRVFKDVVNENSVVEVKDLLARFTIDIIGTCAFGIECNSLKDPNAEFSIMTRKALKDVRHGMVAIAFINSFPDLARKLRMKQTPEHIEKFFMGIVRETVAMREQSDIRRNDFLDMLIDLKNNKSMKSENGEQSNLTIEEIAGQSFVFLLAGFETSSTTMGFALYELAQHEDIQQRVRNEINAVLEQHDGEITYDCLKQMEYLEQVISETLRLYSPVPMISRQAEEDYAVPGYPSLVIRKGMNVFIPIPAIQTDPEFYDNPEVFNPENFSPEMIKNRGSMEYFPFGDGPRNCVGMRFGQMQVRVGLALLLKNFKFSVCEKTQIPLTFDKGTFLLSSETGIYLKVQNV